MDIPAQSQCDVEPPYSDSQFLQVCSGRNCNCGDKTISSVSYVAISTVSHCVFKQNGSCSTVVLRQKDEKIPEPTSHNSTGNLCLFEYHYL